MVKVDLESAKAQVDSLQKTCNSLNDQVNQVQDAVEQFIDNDDLKGKGYQAAKEFGATVMINAWRAVRVAFEAVRKGASKMIENYEDTVDTKSWSDEELDEKIQTLEQDKAQLANQVAMLNKVAKALTQKDNSELLRKMGQSIDTLDDQINHFKEIKQHLHEFDARSSSFMADAQSLISMAMTGINEINNGLNPKTGESTLPDDNQLTWIDDVNEKASKYDSRKEQFIDMMSDAYGLDDEDAKDLYKFQQGIEKYAKKHHKDPMWALSEYNRIIASLGSYDTDSKTGKLEWSQAGYVTWEQAKKLCKKYGLSSKQIKELADSKKGNRILYQQHVNADVKKDLAHESVIIASYSHHEQYHGDMSNKQKIDMLLDNIAVDFGGLPTGVYTVKNTPNRDNKPSIAEDGTTLFNDNVSYRADIMSGSKRASNSNFSADLDAENIYYRAKKMNTVQGVLDTTTQYNEGLKEGKINRKKEFLYNHGGWDTVNQAINSWTPEDYPLKKGATQKQVKQTKHDFKKFLKQKNRQESSRYLFSYDKKIYKFIKATVVVILCLILLGMTIELFLGEKRLYDYNHKYSTDERLTYLANHCKYYGFPRDNFEILKSNDIVAKDFEHFPESDGCTLYLSTKHFDFKIPLYGGGEIEYIYDRVNKTNMVINYNGDYCYGSDVGKDGPIVDKKIGNQVEKELNTKLEEVGHKMKLQIYNPF